MVTVKDYDYPGETAWCPGCGNFGILPAVKKALAKLNLDPHKVLMISGIGQASKLPQYMRVNYFDGLHGRILPIATAARIANPKLTVIAGGVETVKPMAKEATISSMPSEEMSTSLLSCITIKSTVLQKDRPLQQVRKVS